MSAYPLITEVEHMRECPARVKDFNAEGDREAVALACAEDFEAGGRRCDYVIHECDEGLWLVWRVEKGGREA